MSGRFYTSFLIAIGTLRERLQPMPTRALATVAGAAVAFIVSSYGEASILPGSWGPLLMLAVSSQVVGQGLLVYALGHLEPVVAGLCLLVQPVISGPDGRIVHGERLGPAVVIGGAVSGTATVLLRRPTPAVPPPSPIGPSRTKYAD